MPDLEKELARKLAWAVVSTMNPPENRKRQVRAWAWNYAVKIVASYRPFPIEKSTKVDYSGEAGGGAVVVKQSRESASSKSPRPPIPLSAGGSDARLTRPRGGDVRGRTSGRGSLKAHSGEPRRSSGWPSRCWSCIVRGPASYNCRRRSSTGATPSTPSADGRRYADCSDDRVRDLKESSRELHPATD